MANIDLFKIKINGETGGTGGGGGKPTILESLSVTMNGYYIPSDGVDGYSDVNVDVTNETNYSYYDGGVDVEGLRAIGWDDESIGMFRDNSPHYAWQNSEYVVSEENKALYGVIIDGSSIASNKTNPNFKYCPFFDTSNVTTMNNMFSGCTSLTTIPELDTSNVTSMNNMFSGCTSLTTIPELDTSNVSTMYNMFYNCTSLTTIPELDTSNVTDMNYMFYNCSGLTSIPELNTSNVNIIAGLFNGCKSLTSIPKIDTSNVTHISHMFSYCSGLTSIPELDTSKVTNMSYMFSSCSNLTSIPELNTSNVTNMSSMFYYCSKLTSIPELDTSKVTNMRDMFYNCSGLTTIPELDTSKATNMDRMFSDCWNLISIPELDCSNVWENSTPFSYSSLTKLTDLGGFKNLKASWKSNFLDKIPNATVESLVNVLNGLYDFTNLAPDGNVVMPDGTTFNFGTTHTVSFGSDNLAKLTDEQKAIATDKGWTLK